MNPEDYNIGNRVIEFRAWSPAAKEMFYQGDQYLGSFIRRFCALEAQASHESYLKEGSIDPYMMQYVGANDRDNKKIFHGDISKFLDDSGKNQIGVVVIDETGNAIIAFGGDEEGNQNTLIHPYDSDNYKVIGNIFENPELLK